MCPNCGSKEVRHHCRARHGAANRACDLQVCTACDTLFCPTHVEGPHRWVHAPHKSGGKT